MSVNTTEIKPEHVSIFGIQIAGNVNVLMDTIFITVVAVISMNAKLVLTHVPLIIAKIKFYIKMVKNLAAMHKDHGHNRKNGVSITKITAEIPRPETGNFKHGTKMARHKVLVVTTTGTLPLNTTITLMTGAQATNNGNSQKIIRMVNGSNMIGQTFMFNMMALSKVKLKSQTVKAIAGRPN